MENYIVYLNVSNRTFSPVLEQFEDEIVREAAHIDNKQLRLFNYQNKNKK
jgi:hypothetical protein